MFLSAPDALTQKEATETPCKENYYGYEIDMGEIAGTEVAEELNEYKTEFKDFINNAVDSVVDYDKKHKRNIFPKSKYVYLNTENIDFNDPDKIAVHKVYDSYTSFEYNADYDTFLEEVHSANKWRWCIIKNSCAFNGWIYETDTFYSETKYISDPQYGNDAMYIGNYLFIIDRIYGRFSENPTDNWEYIASNSNYLKQNIARLLYDKNEQCKDINVIITDFGWERTRCAVVFVNSKAKYICTYGINFLLFNEYAVSDTMPQELKDRLFAEYSRLYNNADQQSGDKELGQHLKALYPYNMIVYYMRIVHEWNLL